MPVRICTIIARNYLPAARVLATSFVAHHPGGRVTTLVIDDLYAEVDPRAEPFEIMRPGDIGLDSDELHRMATIYDVTELATSLKPWLLAHLLERDGTDAVAYLDPDIRVYAPLDEVSRLAAVHSIVLTPHVTAPLPRDGKLTDEATILAAGMYNLGFIAVGGQAGPFLDFWKERLRRDCVVDVPSNRFVDQRWVDFVPSLFDCHILRDPAYNVAYWNLAHREVRWTGDSYEVAGEPLRFYHFSGFDPWQPDQLSRWQAERPRILLAEHPDLARLCAEYAEAMRAQTRPGDRETPYGFNSLPNGVPLDRMLRSLYRQRLVEAERAGTAPPRHPFSAGGAEELLAWATAVPHGSDQCLPPYLAVLHAGRSDLQVDFPDPEGADHERFLDWADAEAGAGRLHPRLLPARGLSRHGWALTRAAGDGSSADDAGTSLVRLAASRANPSAPSKFAFLSRLVRRLVARLTAHGDAHRAKVDVRLAEAIVRLEARVEEIDRHLGLRAPSAGDAPSIPRQFVSLQAETADRLGELDVRVRVLSERLVRRVEQMSAAVDRLHGVNAPQHAQLPIEETIARLEVIVGVPPPEPLGGDARIASA